MSLKMVLDSVEGLDEQTSTLYEKGEDGKFHLSVEGFDPQAQARVKEFRDNNVNLMKQLKEMSDKYSDIDIEKYNQMVENERKMKEHDLLDKGQIEEYVAQRTERMRQDYESKIESLSKKASDFEREASDVQHQLSSILIDSEIQKAVSSLGALKKNAMTHILNVGRQTWKLESGDLTARTFDGKMIYGKDGANPITFEEWAQTLVKDYPYLFENPEGTQSKGSESRVPNLTGKTSDQLMDLSPETRLSMIYSGGLKKKTGQ